MRHATTATTPDFETPVLPKPGRNAPKSLAAPATIAHLACTFTDTPRRTQFLRARSVLAVDLDAHWAGCLRRMDGPIGDKLALVELWVCLMEIGGAYRRDTDDSPFDDWRIIAAGRSALFEGAARVIGDLIDPVPPPGILPEND